MISSLLLASLLLTSPENGACVPANQPLKLEWRGASDAVYLLNIVRTGGEEQVFAVSNGTSVYVANMEIASRFDWRVRQAGSLDSAAGFFTTGDEGPRLLRAGGVGNFRDFGGWKTASGRRVKQNMIFRSAFLWAASEVGRGVFSRSGQKRGRRITEAGIATLRDEFGIRTDLSLNSSRHGERVGVSALGKGVVWHDIPFETGARIDDVVGGREPFAKIFGLLTAKENYPILVESEGGRDRVDTLALLLNALLGVSEQDLQRGWAASPAEFRSLVDYLKLMPGDTLGARVEAYARGCGVTDGELAAFRALLLE